MGCLGIHFSLSEKEVKKLRSFDLDSERLAYITNEIEEHYLTEQRNRACETDKAWDAINHCFANAASDGKGEISSLRQVILGGESIYAEADYIMDLKSPLQVRAIAHAVVLITEQSLRDRYFAIDQDTYESPLDEEDFEYTWEWFQRLVPFYELASAEERYVLFTVDQ